MRFFLVLTLAFFLSASLHAADKPAPTHTAGNSPPVLAGIQNFGKGDVLQYLDQMIAWYHAISGVDISSATGQEIVLADAAKQNAIKAMASGFGYARAEAPLVDAPEPLPDGSDADPAEDAHQREIKKSALAADEHLAQVQAQLSQINQSLKKASAKTRPTLLAQRDTLDSEIRFAKAQQALLQTVLTSLNSNDPNVMGDFMSRINEMERSIPELRPDITQKSQANTASTVTAAATAAASAATAATSAQAPAHAEAGGIFGLATEIFTLSRKKGELNALVSKTAALRNANDAMRASLKAALRAAIQRANAIGQAGMAGDPQKLADQKQQLDALLTHFKLLAAAVTPLVEQGKWLDCAKKNLLDWNAVLGSQMGSALRSLVLHLAMLGFALLIPLIISEILRRATVRYIKDTRWQQQLKRVRQVVVWCVIALIVVMSFSTEFGSLATFAGFITAGLAVALQNVILSAVAYFFFFGRFGVRVGDRISISGVTGDVVQIGFVRLYMMELGGTNLQLYPTGRIVVFPNSILFQNSPFFKQIPGTNYTWHEITLPLAAEIDSDLAHKRLLAGVEAVYNTYRKNMEQQQGALTGSTHLRVETPRPQGSLRFADTGLAFVIRYPVEIMRSSEIDDQITKQLLHIIQSDPSLKLSGPPKIQTV